MRGTIRTGLVGASAVGPVIRPTTVELAGKVARSGYSDQMSRQRRLGMRENVVITEQFSARALLRKSGHPDRSGYLPIFGQAEVDSDRRDYFWHCDTIGNRYFTVTTAE